MKISILLPYKENFSPTYAGAVSLFINDTLRISKYKKNTTVFGNTEYRNKFRAILYNTAASFYSISLKDEYEPFQDYEDYLIEDILQRSFSDGSLEKQDYALDFDLDELYVFWRDKK